MARPKKLTVDYFPHYCNHGKTMYIIESEFGNNGYAFWYKILELLGKTDNHYLDCKISHLWRFMLAKTSFNEVNANILLNLLSDLDAIDPELWKKHRIIWSRNFVDNLKEVYQRRNENLIDKEGLLHLCKQKPLPSEVNADINPQSKVNNTKLNKSKEDIYSPVISFLNKKLNTTYKSTSKKTKGLINARLKEGFTLQDFKTVIEIKTKQWLNDPAMAKYLRPETLFGIKFESYLNETKQQGEKENDKYSGVGKSFNV